MVPPPAANKASAEPTGCRPGRRISSTPPKPVPIAIQRLTGTASPSSGTDNAVISSGAQRNTE